MTRRRPRHETRRLNRATAWTMIEHLEGRALLAAFTVNSFTDAAAVNATGGDATSTLGAGTITLRSAIQAADATAGASTINLPAGTYTLSIPATAPNDAASGDLNITGSLTLTGAGAATTTINANKIDRVLNITGTGTVVISGVTITGGDDSAANPTSQGGIGGGGIYLQNATLTLNDCAVNGNAANDYGGGGGGIYSTMANLTLNRTTVDSNVARDKSAGGSGSLSGGGIYAAFGQTTILNSTISRNQVGDYGGGPRSGVLHSGGGIGNNFGGKLSVTNSTIRDNIVYGDYGGASQGGGLYDNVGQVTLTDSTIRGNQAVDGIVGVLVAGTGGGGIANFGSFLMSFLDITDSTISGNRSTGPGGGLFLNPSAQASSSSDGFITGATIADNISAGGGAGIYFNEPQPYTIKNTLLSRNFGDGPSDHENFTVGPQAGVLSSLGHNLSTDATTAAVFTATGDLNSVADAKLGPLADNGGPTFTQALLAGSPAIDAGDSTGAPQTDQRGAPRIQGPSIDIGAYEFGVATTTPTNTALVSSLPTAPFGVPITLTATVTRTGSSGTPTGTVNFMEGTTSLGSGTLSSTSSGVAVATLPLTSLPVGPHTITSVYSGDPNFTTSPSTPLVQTITQRDTTTRVTASVNPAVVNQDVQFTATVEAATYGLGSAPHDTVAFIVDGGTPNVVPISVVNGEGAASFHTRFTTAGRHTVVATYSGGTEYASSVSPQYIETVNLVNTSVATVTTITSTPNPSVVGQPVKLSAQVTPLFPVVAPMVRSVHASAVHARVGTIPQGSPPLVGSITFRDGSKVLGVVKVKADGSASLTTTFLTPGIHALTATYSGDPNYRASLSRADIQSVSGEVAPPRVVLVQRYGYHTIPTTLVISFSQLLDPVSAQNATNYRISDAAGEPIDVALARYNPFARTVTLYPVSSLDLHKRYTLTILGNYPGGVAGIDGTLLDGAGTGQPGSNFVTTVDAANLVVTNPFAPGAAAALRLAAWFRAHDRR